MPSQADAAACGWFATARPSDLSGEMLMVNDTWFLRLFGFSVWVRVGYDVELLWHRLMGTSSQFFIALSVECLIDPDSKEEADACSSRSW